MAADLFCLVQTPRCCEERCADTLTRSGAWCTAAHTSASSPAPLMGPWDCGTPTPPHPHWQCSTKTKVATCVMIGFFFFWVFALVEWLTWMCYLFCAQELGVPSSVDLVCSEPAHLVASFTDGQIGLFNMETRQLVLSLESISEPGTIHMEIGLSQVDRCVSQNNKLIRKKNYAYSRVYA